MSKPIKSSICVAILLACALSAGVRSAASQTAPTPASKFQPAAGAVVSGLSGLVTATSGLHDYRSTQRLMVFRAALTEAIKPGLDVTKPISIAPSNVDVLCKMRPNYAVLAAQAAYINSVTSTLSQFATPPTISTIGQAFTSVFQNYQIDPVSGRMSVDAKAVLAACQTDIDKWPLSFYGAPLAGPPKAGIGFLDVGTALSTFGALLSDLNAIVTPVATQAAQFVDATRRAQAITAFLTKYQADLLAAANALAANGNTLLTTNRLQAVGQFEEKLSAVRTFKIDLSKVDACKTAVAAPALADADGTPTDAFVICYAQVWAQLNDVAQAAIVAASQYDAFADESSDQLSNSVQAIQKNIGALKNPQLSAQQLIDAATQLITIGQAVAKTLTSDNLATLQKDAQNVMNAFK